MVSDYDALNTDLNLENSTQKAPSSNSLLVQRPFTGLSYGKRKKMSVDPRSANTTAATFKHRRLTSLVNRSPPPNEYLSVNYQPK